MIQKDRFIAHKIDAQLEELERTAQSSSQHPADLNVRMVQDLQRVHAAQAQEEMRSLERVRERFAAHIAADNRARHEVSPRLYPGERSLARHSPRLRRVGAFAQTLAAILVVGALVGAFLVLLNSHRAGPGSHVIEQHPIVKQQPVVIDTSARWCVVAGVNRAGMGEHLNGVAATSANDAWAVGSSYTSRGFDYTLTEHWNGSRWSIVPSPPDIAGGSLSGGVAAVSADDAWAVGSFVKNDQGSGQTLIIHWNGSHWSVVASPKIGVASTLNAVTALAANDAWAVGWSQDLSSPGGRTQPLILHWNGVQWSIIRSPGSAQPGSDLELNAVTAVSARDIWAAGYADYPNQNGKTLIEHWDGSRWSIVPSPTPDQPRITLLGVTATSAQDVWAVGDTAAGDVNNQVLRTLIEHWDGSRWSIIPSPNPGSIMSVLDDVTAILPDNIWAVGGISNDRNLSAEQTLVEHWNGSRWGVVVSPTPGSDSILLGVSRVPHSNTVIAVGQSSNNGSFLTNTLTEFTCK